MRGFREVLLKGGRLRVRSKLPEAKMQCAVLGRKYFPSLKGGNIFSWVGDKISGEAGSASTCLQAAKQTTSSSLLSSSTWSIIIMVVIMMMTKVMISIKG